MKLRTWYGLIGLAMVLTVVCAGLMADRLSYVDPSYNGPDLSINGPIGNFNTPAMARYFWAVTPHPAPIPFLSPELWSRLLFGTRWTLLFAVTIGLGRVVVGLLVGMAASVGGRGWKWLVGRLYMFATSVPPLLIYLFLFALQAFLPPDPSWQWRMTGVYLAIIVLLEAPRVMVVVQGRLEELQQEPFYEGALAVGNTKFRALRKHLLPHLMPTLVTQFASEVARGLLVVAALGVFHLYLVGRKFDIVGDVTHSSVAATGPLVPEWGNMLADTIGVFRQAPMIPFIPATAFAILVMGFMLLADGTESLLQVLRFPAYWVRNHVRGWQWATAAAVALVAATLLYFQGVPWGRNVGVTQVLQGEVQALAAHQRAAFLAPVSPAAAAFRQEQADLYDAVLSRQATIAGGVGNVVVTGNHATATLVVNATLPGGAPLVLTRGAQLTRRWGRWEDDGYALVSFRSRLATIAGRYDNADASTDGSYARGHMQSLGNLLDDALAHMRIAQQGLLGNKPLPVTFFDSDEALASSLGHTVSELKDVYVWYAPGESLRVSPGFFKGENLQVMSAQLQEQLTKLVVQQAEPNVTAALVLGRAGSTNPLSKVNIGYSDQWVGAPLLSLPDLLRLRLPGFSGEAGRVHTLQAIQLVDWLGKHVPAAALATAAHQPPDAALQTLAAAGGQDLAQFAASYQADLLTHLRGLSLLTTDQGKAKVPAELLQFVPTLATAEAGAAGAKLVASTPLKAALLDAHATLYVLSSWRTAQGSRAGVERWELERSGETWTLLPEQSRLLR